jgi:hypothetical protein
MNLFIVKWLIALSLLAAACAWFFWGAGLDALGDGSRSAFGTVPERAAAQEDANVASVSYRIDPEVNNIHNVEISNRSVLRLASDRVNLSFDLTNLGGVNVYPDLALSMLDASGHVLRSVNVPADSYSDSGPLVQRHVSFEVPILLGEVSLRVTPLYPSAPKS